MILRAQAIGEEPALRFVIERMDVEEWWDGDGFTNDLKYAMKYAHPAEACRTIQAIYKEIYGQLPKRRFVVPVEVEVYGDVSVQDIAEFLYRATVLSVRADEFGNGPKESYVAPTIHWGYIKEVPKLTKIDDLAAEWDIDNIEEEENENV